MVNMLKVPKGILIHLYTFFKMIEQSISVPSCKHKVLQRSRTNIIKAEMINWLTNLVDWLIRNWQLFLDWTFVQKVEDLLLFSVLYHSKMNIFGVLDYWSGFIRCFWNTTLVYCIVTQINLFKEIMRCIPVMFYYNKQPLGRLMSCKHSFVASITAYLSYSEYVLC